jgi:hypothetical protein
MTKLAGTVLHATAALMLAPAISFAGSSSTDWTLGPGGSYSWAGGVTSLVGSDIPVLSVLGDSTPAYNGVSISVTDGLLNFTSGAFDGTSATWSWAGGGTLNLTGCIAGVTAASCTGLNNVALVSDDFTSVSIVQVAGALDAVFGNVTGTINSSVAAYFGGIPTSFSTGSFTTAIFTSGSPGSSFNGSDILGVIKADPVTNTPENWGIAESLVFFAFVMIAFTAMLRWGLLRSHLFLSPRR